MTERKGVAPVGLEVARQRAVDTLMEHFANDVLEMSEFERRLDVANGSATEAELNELLADENALDAKVEEALGVLAEHNARLSAEASSQ